MLIITWILCLTLFIALTSFLGWFFLQDPKSQESLRTLRAGFQTAMKDCGFTTKRKYPVELWVWETMHDEDVCEDCLERASWPPMDIADWMKEGIPGTPEAETECGEHCRCRLVRYHPITSILKRQKH